VFSTRPSRSWIWGHAGRSCGDHDARPSVEELHRLARQLDADVDREVAEAEHERQDALGGGQSDLFAPDEPERGLDQREQTNVPLGHAQVAFEPLERGVERRQRLDVLDLRDHQAVEIGTDHCLDVALQQPRPGAVHACDHHAASVRRERGPDRRARGDLLRVGHRVLEIEHDRVGAELPHPGQAAGMVARGEQK
jgi:hypothetical protein